MSYEGFTQCICTNGHYYEVPVDYAGDGGEDWYDCEECNQVAIWKNPVDDTNCERHGYIETKKDKNNKVIQHPSPYQGHWEKYTGKFQAICQNRHYYQAEMKRHKNLDFLFFPECPHCKDIPVWSERIDNNDHPVEIKVEEDYSVTFNNLPKLTEGIWRFIEGADKINLEDLDKFFHSELDLWLHEERKRIEEDFENYTNEEDPNMTIGMGIFFTYANLYVITGGACFSRHPSYPHEWQVDLKGAEKIFYDMRWRLKTLKNIEN